jgi:hypothetical protein
MQTDIKNIKEGEFFKRTEEAHSIYVRGYYERSLKAFCCHKFDDVNSTIFIKAKKPVFVGFTF